MSQSQEPQPGPSGGINDLIYIHRKGGRVLLHAGHQFIKKATYKCGAELWECCLRKKLKCTGTIKIQGKNIMHETRHVCTPDFNKNVLETYMEQCKEKIVTPDLPAIPKSFNAMISEMKDAGIDKVIQLPAFEGKKSTLYRHKNTKFKIAKTVFKNATAVKIPPKYEKFLLADYCERKTRIIIFCSEEAKQKMKILKDFFGDGTFKSCPMAFSQIYTIHADLGSSIDDTAISPLVYALMSDRKSKTYEILYSLIKSQIPNWNPSTYTCDFEEANMSAIKNIFPAVDLHGCYYHFNKAVFKKGRQLNLTTSKCKRLRRQVELSAVLPLLPEESIMKGWFYIANLSGDDTQSTKFRKYMLSQWLNNQNFIKVWCCFGRRHRTNNFAEGWHFKLNNEVGIKKPTILKILTVFHQDANLYSVKANQSKKNPRAQHIIENDEFILECQMRLINEEITVGHFLEMIR